MRAARLLLREPTRWPLEIACFHAQQCVEKLLKAVLVHRGMEPPRTHDLVLLARLVAETAQVLVDVGLLAQLNRFAVETRYPGDWEPVTRDDAKEAVASARRAAVLLKKTLSVK